MSHFLTIPRSARIIFALGAALMLASCARPGSVAGAGPGGITGGIAAPGSAQDFMVNVGDRVFFTTDSTDLTPVSVATLNKQVQWLQRYSRVAFIVEGHADERGTREYNIALGARRAAAVREFMIAHGIAPNRIRTISYGKERPVAVCDDISCWSQNRRAVTVITNAPGV